MDEEKNLEDYDELDIAVGNDEQQVYPMNGIKIDKGFFTVFELKRRYDAKPRRIKLDSEFQREDVWKIKQKAELVESVLMGLPLPIFYFNQDKYGNLIVVDGRQRLTALFQFLSNEYSLGKLKILNSLDNRYFDDLPPVYQTRIEDFQIQAHVIMPPTPDRIKFDIFDRVNRGGMQLNKQEIRNALYQGKATIFLKKVVESEEFKNATGKAFEKEKRMKDKYLITRFISLYLYKNNELKGDAGNKYQYKGDIDELLGKGLELLNAMSDEERKSIEKTVINALKMSYKYLGEDAFRLVTDGRKGPINMNVFEAVMFIMVEIDKTKNGIIDKDNVWNKVNIWIDSTEFRENIGNRRDSVPKLQWRLDQAIEIGKDLSVHDKKTHY